VSTTAALASALAKAQPGDRVLVADGVYDAPVTVSRSGTAGVPITIAAQNAGRAQLTNADAIQFGKVSNVVIQGFTFAGNGGLSVPPGAAAIRITRNTFASNKSGAFLCCHRACRRNPGACQAGGGRRCWQGAAGPGGSSDPSLDHVLSRLAVTEARVRDAVLRRCTAPREGSDPFRGLYLSDGEVDRLLTLSPPARHNPEIDEVLARVEADADRAEAAGAPLRLRHLQRTLGLRPVDVDLLLLALAPDVDQRFERLYGYLHDGLTRRRASIGLALEQRQTLAASMAAWAARHRAARREAVDEAARRLEDRGLRVTRKPD